MCFRSVGMIKVAYLILTAITPDTSKTMCEHKVIIFMFTLLYIQLMTNDD